MDPREQSSERDDENKRVCAYCNATFAADNDRDWFCSRRCETETISQTDQEEPAWRRQGARAIRELHDAVNLAVSARAPYVARLQHHVAAASYHCGDVETLRRALKTLRGPGHGESDAADAVATAAAWTREEVFDDAESNDERRKFVLREMSPHAPSLPKDAEIDESVLDELNAASRRARAEGTE